MGEWAEGAAGRSSDDADEGRTMPQHVAIIMDGNGRWARQRGRPRASGHQAGFRTTRDIVEVAARRDIRALTLFAFSSENWRRPEKEVSLLMDLFLRALSSEVDKLRDNNIRMRFIGDRSAFQDNLQREMRRAESVTDANDGMELAIAVNYGGRWDIANAARRIAEEVRSGLLDPADVDVACVASRITLADLPEPDLFIRTGGEQRISNYLLWHLAYTELYFTDVLWPDFSEAEFETALQHFAGRQRRFGRTGEQVIGSEA